MRKFTIEDFVIVKKTGQCGEIVNTSYDSHKQRTVYFVKVVKAFSGFDEYQYLAKDLTLFDAEKEKDKLFDEIVKKRDKFEKDFERDDTIDCIRVKMNEIRDLSEDVEEKLSIIDDLLNEIEERNVRK